MAVYSKMCIFGIINVFSVTTELAQIIPYMKFYTMYLKTLKCTGKDFHRNKKWGLELAGKH